jgi:hypothetical protein
MRSAFPARRTFARGGSRRLHIYVLATVQRGQPRVEFLDKGKTLRAPRRSCYSCIRDASRTTSLAELYLPGADLLAKDRPDSGVSETFLGKLSGFHGAPDDRLY